MPLGDALRCTTLLFPSLLLAGRLAGRYGYTLEHPGPPWFRIPSPSFLRSFLRSFSLALLFQADGPTTITDRSLGSLV